MREENFTLKGSDRLIVYLIFCKSHFYWHGFYLNCSYLHMVTLNEKLAYGYVRNRKELFLKELFINHSDLRDDLMHSHY